MGESNCRWLSIWLLFTAFCVFCMALIGAITRLTESGLSIVEWQPVTGTLPPLSAEEWQRQFALYKQTPEYVQQHFWMELEDFKKIFFWEWLHRFWGRLIGLVYVLPLTLFWIRSWIPPSYKTAFLLVLSLGAAQGLLGWYMVTSGLVDRPDVSHFRLAAHLGVAFILFSLLLWLALSLLRGWRKPLPVLSTRGQSHGHSLLICFFAAVVLCLCATLVWGAFVAGLDGGMIYNSWPKMGEEYVPQETFEPVALIKDPGWVQFTHRWLAAATFVLLLIYSVLVRDFTVALAAMLQAGLGLATLISQVWIVPAVAHQGGAFILVLALLVSFHRYISESGEDEGPDFAQRVRAEV